MLQSNPKLESRTNSPIQSDPISESIQQPNPNLSKPKSKSKPKPKQSDSKFRTQLITSGQVFTVPKPLKR